jgi:hypothetical protein
MFLPIILPTNQNYPSSTPTGNGTTTPPSTTNTPNNQYRQQQLVKYVKIIENNFNIHFEIYSKFIILIFLKSEF